MAGGKTMGDGGSCVTRETLAEPIAAGVRDVGPRGDRAAEGASIHFRHDPKMPTAQLCSGAVGPHGAYDD